ncbi:MAG: hypothetical protein JO314_00740 [Acidobacteria bacterium]|nr:hypothetical protein [Acidobacteriota bacterium]
MAKEILILVARSAGAGVMELSVMTGLDTSNVSRRQDAAREKCSAEPKMAYAKALVEKEYARRIAETQA